MIDRLAKLQQINRPSVKINPDDHAENPLLNTHEEKVFNNIVELFNNVKENLKKVNGNLEILDQMGSALLKTVDNESEKKVNNGMSTIIRTNLDFFKKNKQLFDVIKNISMNAESDVVKNRKDVIEQNFKDLMGENERVMKLTLQKEEQYETKMKDRVKRELKAVDETLDDNRINEIVDKPDELNKVLQGKILGSVHLNIQNYVKDIKEKYSYILILEEVPLLECQKNK